MNDEPAIEPVTAPAPASPVMDFSHLSKGRAPWARAEYLARLLRIKKVEAFDLWPALDQTLMTDLLRLPAPTPEAVDKAKQVYLVRAAENERKRAEKEERDRQSQERWAAERRQHQQRRLPKPPKPPVETETTPLGRIKIMLWAITKCGSTEAAKLAWGKAIKMAEEVDEEAE